jgi:hypothetical protein
MSLMVDKKSECITSVLKTVSTEYNIMKPQVHAPASKAIGGRARSQRMLGSDIPREAGLLHRSQYHFREYDGLCP